MHIETYRMNFCEIHKILDSIHDTFPLQHAIYSDPSKFTYDTVRFGSGNWVSKPYAPSPIYIYTWYRVCIFQYDT